MPSRTSRRFAENQNPRKRRLGVENLEDRRLLAAEQLLLWEFEVPSTLVVNDVASNGQVLDYGFVTNRDHFPQLDTSAAWIDQGVLNLDGTNGYVTYDLNHAKDSDPAVSLHSTDARTYTLEFLAHSVVDRQVLYKQGSANHGMNIYVENGTLNAGAWRGDDDFWITTEINSNTWYQVEFVIDLPSSTAELSVNSKKIAQAIPMTALIDAHPGTLGSNGVVNNASTGIFKSTRFPDGNSTQPYGFKGQVDNFAIYKFSYDSSENDRVRTYLDFNSAVNGHVPDVATGGSVLDNAQLVNGASLTHTASFFSNNQLDEILSVNGQDQYVRFERSLDLNMGNYADRSIGFWFRPDRDSITSKHILYKQGNVNHGMNIYLEQSNGVVHVNAGAWNMNEGAETWLTAPMEGADTAWHYVVFSVDPGGNLSLTVDGNVEAAPSGFNQFKPRLPGTIGASGEVTPFLGLPTAAPTRYATRFADSIGSANEPYAFSGDFDEFKIFEHFLNAQEIDAEFVTKYNSDVIRKDTGASVLIVDPRNPNCLDAVDMASTAARTVVTDVTPLCTLNSVDTSTFLVPNDTLLLQEGNHFLVDQIKFRDSGLTLGSYDADASAKPVLRVAIATLSGSVNVRTLPEDAVTELEVPARDVRFDCNLDSGLCTLIDNESGASIDDLDEVQGEQNDLSEAVFFKVYTDAGLIDVTGDDFVVAGIEFVGHIDVDLSSNLSNQPDAFRIYSSNILMVDDSTGVRVSDNIFRHSDSRVQLGHDDVYNLGWSRTYVQTPTEYRIYTGVAHENIPGTASTDMSHVSNFSLPVYFRNSPNAELIDNVIAPMEAPSAEVETLGFNRGEGAKFLRSNNAHVEGNQFGTAGHFMLIFEGSDDSIATNNTFGNVSHVEQLPVGPLSDYVKVETSHGSISLTASEGMTVDQNVIASSTHRRGVGLQTLGRFNTIVDNIFTSAVEADYSIFDSSFGHQNNGITVGHDPHNPNHAETVEGNVILNNTFHNLPYPIYLSYLASGIPECVEEVNSECSFDNTIKNNLFAGNIITMSADFQPHSGYGFENALTIRLIENAENGGFDNFFIANVMHDPDHSIARWRKYFIENSQIASTEIDLEVVDLGASNISGSPRFVLGSGPILDLALDSNSPAQLDNCDFDDLYSQAITDLQLDTTLESTLLGYLDRSMPFLDTDITGEVRDVGVCRLGAVDATAQSPLVDGAADRLNPDSKGLHETVHDLFVPSIATKSTSEFHSERLAWQLIDAVFSSDSDNETDHQNDAIWVRR